MKATPYFVLICIVSLLTAANASDGVPAQMKAGSTVQIAMKLRNTGSNNWSSTGDSPVRFVLRWIDAENHVRYRWAVKWFKGTVQPGESAVLRFELEAPSRASRYQLMCGLVRLNSESYDGENYHPPATDAADQHWSGEFATVTYHVNVQP